jgi:hypothetical protein
LLRAPATLSLIFVDHDHTAVGPAQGDSVPRQVVLSQTRFLVLDYLLWRGLPNVNDRQSVEMSLANLGRQEGANDRLTRGCRLCCIGFGQVRHCDIAVTHCSPPRFEARTGDGQFGSACEAHARGSKA